MWSYSLPCAVNCHAAGRPLSDREGEQENYSQVTSRCRDGCKTSRHNVDISSIGYTRSAFLHYRSFTADHFYLQSATVVAGMFSRKQSASVCNVTISCSRLFVSLALKTRWANPPSHLQRNPLVGDINITSLKELLTIKRRKFRQSKVWFYVELFNYCAN